MRIVTKAIRWLPACLMVVIVGNSAGQDGQPGRRTDPAPQVKLPALLTAEPIKEDPKDDALRGLQKARYNAALAEAKHWYVWERTTIADFIDIQDYRYGGWQRVVNSALAVYDAPAVRVAILTKYLELTKEAEADQRARHGAGRCSIEYVHRAEYERLNAEIQLLREKRAAEAAKGK